MPRHRVLFFLFSESWYFLGFLGSFSFFFFCGRPLIFVQFCCRDLSFCRGLPGSPFFFGNASGAIPSLSVKQGSFSLFLNRQNDLGGDEEFRIGRCWRRASLARFFFGNASRSGCCVGVSVTLFFDASFSVLSPGMARSPTYG